MNSILDSIKKMLGIDSTYTAFDTDIIIHINSVFMVLRQIGAGPKEGFSITGQTETWGDYISDMSLLELIKTYMYLKVRMIFDPPTSSSTAEAFKNQISEFEWRISVQVDPERSSNDE